MAIAPTARVQVQSSVDGTSYATDTGGTAGAFTPANGSLVLAAVLLFGDATDPSSVTGNAQTWTKVAGTTFNSAADSITIYACIASSATSTVVTVSTGNSRTGGMIFVNEVTGAYVSGTTADAIAQSAPGGGGPASTGSVTLAAGANAANRAYAIFCQTTTTGNIVAGTNWTGLFGTGKQITLPSREGRDIWRSDAFDTTPNVTLGASAVWGGLGIEIREASAPPAGTTAFDQVGMIPI